MLSSAFSVINDGNLIDTNINNPVSIIANSREVAIFMNFKREDLVDLKVVETKNSQVLITKICKIHVS